MKLRLDLHKIFRRGWPWDWKQSTRLWEQNGFGSGVRNSLRKIIIVR